MSAQSALPELVVLVPLLAAAALALVRDWRAAVWGNLAASGLAFLLACRLPFALGGTGWMPVDRLAAHFVLLTSFVGLTTAWFSRSYVAVEVEAGRLDPPRLRLYHAMFQALLGCMLLALLSDNPGVTWMAVEGATIAGVLVVQLPRTAGAIEASWKYLILCGVGIALALLGTIVLYLAAIPALGPGWAAMRWSALIPAAAGCNGVILNLAFVFLLIGYGTTAGLAPLHVWLPDAQAEGPVPVSAVLSGSILNVALFVILRLRQVMAANAAAGHGAIDPGPPIMALGLLSLLLAAFSLWRRRDVKRFFAVSTVGQTGVAAYAFGLGGPGAVFAGLLHLTLHTLAKAAVFQCVGHAAQLKAGQTFAEIGGLMADRSPLGLTLAAGIIAVAGLPPFGLFSSEFLIVTETLARLPWLALPLGIGLVVGAWALVGRLQALCLGEATPDRGPSPDALALTPAWVHLALVLVLGLVMPGVVFAWMRAVAAGAG